MNTPGKQPSRYVNASELAKLGYCERKVGFDLAHGEATTDEQNQARARGKAGHATFYTEGEQLARGSSARKGRCFIATLALGECKDTLALREYRDVILRRTPAGRICIKTYYRYSPTVCRVLAHSPWLIATIRPPLRALAGLVNRVVRRKLGQ